MRLVSLMLEVMKVYFLLFIKIKAYRCYNQITKTIMESENVRIDEKFRIQERIVDYNLADDVFIKLSNDE